MRETNLLETVLHDPVLSALELPYRATYFPLGFPLELATNSAQVQEAAAAGWGEFRQRFDAEPVRVELGVSAGGSSLPPASTFRAREHLMFLVADPENFMVCDFNRGFSFGWITEAVAFNHAAVRYRFLTAAGLTLVEQRSLASVHCGLILRNGCGVALLGDSYAGKSTLAYACARAGWTLVCDDGAGLVRNRADRYAVGNPYSIHLREDARAIFPEFQDRVPRLRPNGKEGIEIFTQELPIQLSQGGTIDHVVFLNRDEPGPARIRRYPKDELLRSFERYATFGTREVREAQWRSYERLLTAGIWEIRYRDLDDAIARLERLVDSGD